jgi:tripartite-type tricarboxylate transporter receptor subunit TctC
LLNSRIKVEFFDAWSEQMFLSLKWIVSFLLIFPSLVFSQSTYPIKSIRLVTPFEAGGTVDVIGRSVVNVINKRGVLNIFIDNKPGANAMIGSLAVAKAQPDGYTILNVSPSIIINTLVSKPAPYDTLKDFSPIGVLGIGSGYLLVVRKDLAVNSVQDLIAMSKSAPNPLTYGTPGIGNALHLATENFAAKAGIQFLHIPFKGSAGALNAIVASQVDVMVLSPATVLPFKDNGQLKVLAFTGSSRGKDFPSTPTMKEAGVDDCVIKGTWVGWFAPKGTPSEVINKLSTEIKIALKDPQLKDSMNEGGFDADGRNPAEFINFVKNEQDRYAEIIKRLDIQIK